MSILNLEKGDSFHCPKCGTRIAQVKVDVYGVDNPLEYPKIDMFKFTEDRFWTEQATQGIKAKCFFCSEKSYFWDPFFWARSRRSANPEGLQKLNQYKLGQEIFFKSEFSELIKITRGKIVSINCDDKLSSDMRVLFTEDGQEKRNNIKIEQIVNVPTTRKELYDELRRMISEEKVSKTAFINRVRGWRDLGIININLPSS